MRSSEDRAVADDAAAAARPRSRCGQRRGPPPTCRPPARRPAASARRRCRGAHAPAAPLRRAGPPSGRATRPPVHRPPTRCARAQAGSRSRSTPVSSSRPPLRYSGSPVSASRPRHRHAGPLERFQQRVGQPLRQLVERHPARVSPGPATAGCGQQSPSGRSPMVLSANQIPDRRYQKLGQDVVCGDRGGRRPAQHVEQAAGPAASRTPRAARPAHRPADAAATRPSRPTSGLSGRTWNASARRAGVRRAGRRRRPAAARAGSLENSPAAKACQLATPSPSERVNAAVPASTIPQSGPAPASSSTLTTVRSIIARARAAASQAPARIQLGPAVDTAGLEMAPAAVVRDGQVGVAGPGDVDDFGRGVRQGVVVHGEPRESPARARLSSCLAR